MLTESRIGLLSVNSIQKFTMLLISAPKVNDYYAHVVAPLPFSSVDVGRQQRVQQTLDDFRKLHFPLHLNVDVINDLLACFGFPDAITPHYQEVRFVRQLMDFYVRH